MFNCSRSQRLIDYLMLDLKQEKSTASALSRPQGALAKVWWNNQLRMVIQLLLLLNKVQRKRVWAPSDHTAGWMDQHFSVGGLTEACTLKPWSFESAWHAIVRTPPGCCTLSLIMFNFIFSVLPLLFCVAHRRYWWRRTVEEEGDKNSHRGQKAIYLYQLELILTDKGRREDCWKGISKSLSLAVFRYLSRLCPDFWCPRLKTHISPPNSVFIPTY